MSSSSSVKIPRPRPLNRTPSSAGTAKTSTTAATSSSSDVGADASDVLQLLQGVCARLKKMEKESDSSLSDSVTSAIVVLNRALKSRGTQLESGHAGDDLEALFGCLRAACRDDRLDMASRLHLLEIIELRSLGWRLDPSVAEYYQQKLALVEASRFEAVKHIPLSLFPFV